MRENKTILKMWNAARARLLKAEGDNFSCEGDAFLPVITDSSKDMKGKEAEGGDTGRRSRKRVRRSTRKGGPLTKADKEQGGGVLSLANSKPSDGVAQGEFLQFEYRAGEGRLETMVH